MPTCLQIVSEGEDWLPEHLASVEQTTRKRAFDYSCRRTAGSAAAGCPDEDWSRARHEGELCPIAAIEETDRELKISAAVPGEEATLRIHVMPLAIVIESRDRGSILRLPSAIRRDKLRATFRDHELTIVVEKAA